MTRAALLLALLLSLAACNSPTAPAPAIARPLAPCRDCKPWYPPDVQPPAAARVRA